DAEPAVGERRDRQRASTWAGLHAANIRANAACHERLVQLVPESLGAAALVRRQHMKDVKVHRHHSAMRRPLCVGWTTARGQGFIQFGTTCVQPWQREYSWNALGGSHVWWGAPYDG